MKKAAMTYPTVFQKTDVEKIYDRQTKASFDLPEKFRISFHDDPIWYGHSDDGKQHLFIERIPLDQVQVPTIQADGDLDISVAAVRPLEGWTPRIRGIEAAGTIAGKAVDGFIALIRYDQRYSYTVLVASEIYGERSRQVRDAITIAQIIQRS